MPASRQMNHPPAGIQILGKTAHELLTPQWRGRILAVVSHAAYLLGSQGELLWLVDETVPLHRRAIRLDSPLPGLEVESACRVDNHRLRIEPETCFGFERASVWTAPRLRSANIAARTDLSVCPRAVVSILRRLPEARGLGRLLPVILPDGGDQALGPAAGPETGPLAKARPVVEEIARACRRREFHLIPQYAGQLVGLGEGLTPSGDDFLGGLLFGLRLLREAMQGISGLTDWLDSDFISRCQPLTNPISFAILQDHAEGHGLEPLHRFANSLLAVRPADELLPFARQLTGVGHSTGWDVLTGFLTGMTAVCLT